jgi:hypothetical protein
MVSVQTIRTLNFGSSEEPAAFIQLKSIGLPLNLNSVASRLTDLMVTHAGLKPGRVFITFADVPPSRWAHDGATFA